MNFAMRLGASGYEIYVVDESAIDFQSATYAYSALFDLVQDRSFTARIGLVGQGLSATFAGSLGRVSGTTTISGVFPTERPGVFDVMVQNGGVPSGVKVRGPRGDEVTGWEPDFIVMAHELLGETLSARFPERLPLGSDIAARIAIIVENQIRAYHGLPPRTGTDHGPEIITVRPRK
jgi:hypothetical protein